MRKMFLRETARLKVNSVCLKLKGLSLPVIASFFLLFIFPVYLLAEVKFFTSVSPKQGTLSDRFSYQVTIEGAGKADYPVLGETEDFKVTLIGPQHSMSIINGAMSQSTTYSYKLTPLREGVLKTPSAKITINGERFEAPALDVRVAQGKPASLKSNADLILRQSSSQSEVFLGQQIVLNIDFYRAVDIAGAQFDQFNFDDFWVEELGKEQVSERYIRGRPFTRHRLRKALFPLRSGALTLPPQIIEVKVREITRTRKRPGFLGFDPFRDDFFNNFFMSSRIISKDVRSNDLKISVKELPAPPADFPDLDLATPLVGELDLTLKEHGPQKKLKVGESRTISITIKSTANLNALKELPFKADPEIQVYPERPSQTIEESEGKLIFIKTFRYSLVPAESGEWSIPQVKIPYFDPDNKSYRLATTRPLKLSVLKSKTSALKKSDRKTDKPSSETLRSEEHISGSALSNKADSELDRLDESKYPQYEPLTFLEKLSEQISLSLSLFLVAVILTILAVVILVVKLRRSHLPVKQAIRDLKSANNAEQLAIAYKTLLAHSVLDTTALAGDGALRKELRARLKSSEPSLLFLIETTLDELDQMIYSRELSEDTDFATVKEKALKLIGSIS